MQFTCDQSRLKSVLSSVSRIVSDRPLQPILSTVKIEADSDSQKIHLTTSNLSVEIKLTMDVKFFTTEYEGAICLPCKLLTQIVSSLPSGTLTFECDEEFKVTLSSQQGNYVLKGMAINDFPKGLTSEHSEEIKPVEVKLEGIAWLQNLKTAFVAVAKEEVKQILTGVNIKAEEGNLAFAATEGHRLVIIDQSFPSGQEAEFDITVPAQSLRELERIVTIESTPGVTLSFDQNQVKFAAESWIIVSRILNGAYPRYRQLVPATFNALLTVNKKDFLGAVERLSLLADSKSNSIRFNFKQGKLVLSVATKDIGSGTEILDAVSDTNEELNLAFNNKYLLEGIASIETDEIKLKLNIDKTPSVFTPVDGINLIYLLMPVQITE